MRPVFRPFSLAILLIAVACSPSLTPAPPPTQTPAIATGTPESGTASPPSSPTEIVLWVPPEFDPQAENEAAAMFAARLQGFAADRPNVSVRVRLKSKSGPGGLLETLRAASTAAPEALPDLVLLDPTGLNTAALKDLVVPLTGIMEPPDEGDWYPYAQEAAQIDGEFYGYPFASDATVLAYRPGAFETPPLAWTTLLESERRFLFPAGDPQALFTLAQYQAIGGSLLSESGRPALDPTSLAEVLAFYSSLQDARLLPSDATEFETESETWDAMLSGRVHSATSPLSSYLQTEGSQLISTAPLLTREGAGVSLAHTWSWAVVSRDPARQTLAAQLVQWLHEPEFLGVWTQATGLLPPTVEALDHWTEGPSASSAALLANSLRATPSQEIMATFGPPLQEAVLAVLETGKSPDAAALEAVQALQVP